MFFKKRNSSLLWSAWSDLSRRIRWRLFFAFQDDDKPYDPDYDVREAKASKPPGLPHYIEYGLKEGNLLMRRIIDRIDRSDKLEPTHAKSLSPQLNAVQEFLDDHNYVVTITDKNLGVCVSERQWLSGLCLDLIQNTNDYVELTSELTINQYLDSQHEKVLNLSKSALLIDLPDFPCEQLSGFLRHFVILIDKEHKKVPGQIAVRQKMRRDAVPQFYGIPKIHKTPTKVRPIIPCHSAVQNPAAKFVSKELKALINASPTVIHGSKDLAFKLSLLKLPKRGRYYIVTGDVVAFYPNIPVDRCIQIVSDLYFETTIGHFAPDPNDINSIRNRVSSDNDAAGKVDKYLLFHECLKVAVKNLITQYDGKFYRQARGLAMGVACSPDLANLYGAHFENRSNVINHPQIPFYGRFIDDCLGLVFSNSAEEAVALMDNLVKYDGCVIEWNVSASHSPFLDMMLFRETDGSLQHMPYRKARNHTERIPWISYHPEDVKRGTFIGEMSRLATLSSQHTTYLSSMENLCDLYHKRGYPPDKVRHWLKANIRERWEKRLSPSKPAPEGLLVLKTEFNSAWNYFHAKELGDAVIGTWRTWLEHADASDWRKAKYGQTNSSHEGLEQVAEHFLSEWSTTDGPAAMPDIRKIGFDQKRFILSRRRNRNLFDLTSLWKKTAFSALEKRILAEQAVMIEDEDMSPLFGPEESELPISGIPTMTLHRAETPPSADDLEHVFYNI